MQFKIVLAGLLALVALPAMAAVTSNSNINVQTPNRGIVQFLEPTDAAGTYKTLYTGGANGSICTGITATTNDSAVAHLVTIQIVNTAVKYGGTAVNIPVSSGFTAAAPPVTIMSGGTWPGLPIDGNGNQYFHLVNGDTLQATFASGLTGSTFLNLIAVCGDF